MDVEEDTGPGSIHTWSVVSANLERDINISRIPQSKKQKEKEIGQSTTKLFYQISILRDIISKVLLAIETGKYTNGRIVYIGITLYVEGAPG